MIITVLDQEIEKTEKELNRLQALRTNHVYKGHFVDWDHTGNSVTIDGHEFAKFWHETTIENPMEFARFILDATSHINHSFSE
jgi:hypothetical protein